MAIAYIALGSNVAGVAGDPAAMVAEAGVRLGSLGRVVACSSLYKTAPVGAVLNQPEFVNAAVALETALEPIALLVGMQAIEREMGRDREQGVKDGPRTLDLDLLMMDGRILNGDMLVLPHPRLEERAFVLVPLAEIAAGVEHPVRNRTVGELLATLPEAHDDEVYRLDRDDLRVRVCGGAAAGEREGA